MVSEENANQEVISQQEENTPSPGAMLKARQRSWVYLNRILLISFS